MTVIHSSFTTGCFDADDHPAILPAGKYYIGDPCYVVSKEDWEFMLEATDFFEGEGLFTFRGHKLAVYSTAWGDGLYPGYCHADGSLHSFGVDAGLLGAIPEELVSEEAKNCQNTNEMWIVVEEDGALVCWKEGRGLIHLGPVSIVTDEEYDNDEESW